jgi:FAD:protein FMN transferase
MAPQGPTRLCSPGLAALHRPEEGQVPARRMRMGLGTWVVIEATAASAACALAGLEAAFACVGHVEARMHPLREGSDLARLGAARCGTRVAIDRATWEVLHFAQRLFALTDGVFDPCLPHSCGRLCDLELSSRTESPWACAYTPVSLDCGGFAKGYAVDCALGALRSAGCTAGLVNAGGDVRVCGPQPQTLLLRRPDGSYLPCQLHEAALAVSDPDATNRPAEHRGYYVRGASAGGEARRYAAVRASEAMVADALTKCVLLCAPVLAQAVVRVLAAEILA